jgi:hypothetical protein
MRHLAFEDAVQRTLEVGRQLLCLAGRLQRRPGGQGRTMKKMQPAA